MTAVKNAKVLIQIGHGSDPAMGPAPKILWADGVPDNSLPQLVGVPVGTLCIDADGADLYICTVSNGTWVLIGPPA